MLALKAREDLNTVRVEIQFWTTFSATKGGFCGAELALTTLALGQDALNNSLLCQPKRNGDCYPSAVTSLPGASCSAMGAQCASACDTSA